MRRSRRISSGSTGSGPTAPIAQAGTAARAVRTSAAAAEGSRAVVGEDRLEVEREPPALGRRAPRVGRYASSAAARKGPAGKAICAEDLEQLGVADRVEQARACSRARASIAVPLRVACRPRWRRPRSRAAAPARRLSPSGRRAKVGGRDSRSIRTVTARAPSRSMASGTVPTALSRSTESALARISRSSVSYGSSAATGMTAAGSNGDLRRICWRSIEAVSS